MRKCRIRGRHKEEMRKGQEWNLRAAAGSEKGEKTEINLSDLSTYMYSMSLAS